MWVLGAELESSSRAARQSHHYQLSPSSCIWLLLLEKTSPKHRPSPEYAWTIESKVCIALGGEMKFSLDLWRGQFGWCLCLKLWTIMSIFLEIACIVGIVVVPLRDFPPVSIWEAVFCGLLDSAQERLSPPLLPEMRHQSLPFTLSLSPPLVGDKEATSGVLISYTLPSRVERNLSLSEITELLN